MARGPRISLQTGPAVAHTPPVPCVISSCLELMDDTTTLGPYLRAERERRDLTLRTISESTKVSLPLLEGLESDDISRWPGGIFRRAFVRTYAEAVGLDPDDVFRRFERQTSPPVPETAVIDAGTSAGRNRGAGAGQRGLPWCVRRADESGPGSGHGRRSDRRAGAGLWQRRCRFATPLAGPPHRRILCRWGPPHRDQPHGGSLRRGRFLGALNHPYRPND